MNNNISDQYHQGFNVSFDDGEQGGGTHPYFFATGIAYFACFAVGSVLNVSVLGYLLVHFRKMILTRSSGILIFSLTLCDLLFVSLAFLYAIQHVTHDFMAFGMFSCQLPGYDIALMHVNIWTTLAVCVQRLAAIKWPFEYSQMFSRQRCLIIMGGIWASSAVVGVPMGVFYEYKKVEIPEEGDTQAPEYACFIRGGDLQFLLTNVTVYIVDFLVPAVLVTKYYWEFSVEVRRRSGGVTSTTNAPAASNTPQNNNNNNNNNNGNSMQHGNGIPRCNAISQVPPLRASQENRTHSNHPRGTCLNGVVNNCTTGDVEETPPSEHIELAKSAQSSCDVTVMTASTSRPKVAHCLSNTGNQNSKNDINSNNINNSSISGHNSNAAVSPNTANSNTNPGAILAHRFLQLYASVVSVSCWVCFTPFYNMKFIQSVDAVTGLHVYHWIKPTGVGTYIDRTSIALCHLNSLVNPMLFIGLKLYMKHSREQRAHQNNAANAMVLNQRKISAVNRTKKQSSARSNAAERGGNGDQTPQQEEHEAVGLHPYMEEMSTSMHMQSEQTEA